MTTAQIRKKYLDFFKARGHQEITPSPLIPENDPTTLFTSSGMQPLIPYLLGEKHPQGKRLVNSQPSFRSQDIDEVGDNRHTTFFEMLGNWSLGDYFKKEQLEWFFEFLTRELKLDPQKLYVSVFQGDEKIIKDEVSIAIWQEIFSRVGIEAKIGERIFSYDVEKNWWSRSGHPANMPVGEPGGPDSEVFYDFGTQHSNAFGKNCHPNCDCGRFLEIGNSVFMEYQKVVGGGFIKLPRQNVDFGGGLERLSAAVSNQSDIFKIDVFSPLIKTLQGISGKDYFDPKAQKAFRIISDHIRACVFMISDGVFPSNKTQGYILRRLIRRSIVYAKELGIDLQKKFLNELISPIVNIYKEAYPLLSTKQTETTLIIEEEVLRFNKTLDKGLKEIEKLTQLDGKSAFGLYETYGFPWEMTMEIARNKGIQLDKTEFTQEFKKHQNLSRSTSRGLFKGGLADSNDATKKLHTATHILHAVLRKILGDHIVQKGSNITAERLRFDFSHPQKLSTGQIMQIEKMVNEVISQNLPVTFKITKLETAIKEGSLALFQHKYDQKVKVYTIGNSDSGWYSKEVCGGPHVDFTSSLGHFTMIKEESAGAGVRRIYAKLD